MGEILSDKEIQDFLDALKALESDPEEIPKERETEEIGNEKRVPEIPQEWAKDKETLLIDFLNALDCD